MNREEYDISYVMKQEPVPVVPEKFEERIHEICEEYKQDNN